MSGEMAAPMLIWPPTTLVLKWPDGPSSSRWKRRAASLPFGTRTKSSSCFPSKAWSDRRWSWPTICSTSSKRRWRPRDVRLSGGPGKSDSRLCGEKELDVFFHPRLSHRLASPSGKCRNPLSPCRVKTSDNQKQPLIGAALPSDFHSSSSHTPAFPYSTSAVSMTESRTLVAQFVGTVATQIPGATQSHGAKEEQG